MRFFTNGTWRPRLPSIEQIDTPIGQRCLACGAAITTDDCGISMIHADATGDAYRPWHLTCFRASLGIESAQA
jgi:hypothetical protein